MGDAGMACPFLEMFGMAYELLAFAFSEATTFPLTCNFTGEFAAEEYT
jgi:hypothetical protein